MIILLFITLIFKKENVKNVSIDNKNYQKGNGETASEYLISNTNGSYITEYPNGDATQMYTFVHEGIEQTEALIDYRYIENNYVYFNYTDDNNTDTC